MATESELAPITLIQGAESVLVERAEHAIREAALDRHPSMERTSVDAAGYTAGTLAALASPSLFAEPRYIVIDELQAAPDELISDALRYLAAPEPDVYLVLIHRGGVRGKKLLDAMKKAGVPKLACDPLKKDADKLAFVMHEFKTAKRRATTEAAEALVNAVGSDLRELAAACTQLISDSEGMIDVTQVDRYYGGRVEVSSFRVADAAVAGRSQEAIVALRHAFATGADPVPLIATLAMKLRTLALVAGHNGSPAAAAKELGMAPWQVERARKDLRGWTPQALASAIIATAAADADVKGAARDPHFAVERAVLTIATRG
ncbi:DNA polymerase III subunit delta [Rarobacter faecitabidus]|uniref:DNA-directed DNA polymerase n=1 Tax=Rarobacter faecitabidus TaxID=13243 RepID=A0A542ZV29_RARFA|nr:DNA polymerase III subunit delta [Rarobacter faecitabidus]TQL64159.1 DNA polymerase III delta subunit [Rarobacter faecitabidus]